MESNDIKKALDEAELFLRNRVKDGQPIKLNDYDVGKLRNISQTCARAYDEIDQLQTENENSRVENQSLRSAANSLKMHYEEAQAEIERLKPFEDKIAEFKSHIRVEDMLVFASSLEEWLEFCDNLKAEVYKECIEKVKNYTKTHCNPYGKPDFDYDTSIKILNFIDNLAKEMAGE